MLWKTALSLLALNIKEQKSCTITDIAATSFFPAKPLGCYGDGGAVFTKNTDIAKKIRMILESRSERKIQSILLSV